jgi:hypothetical protein
VRALFQFRFNLGAPARNIQKRRRFPNRRALKHRDRAQIRPEWLLKSLLMNDQGFSDLRNDSSRPPPDAITRRPQAAYRTALAMKGLVFTTFYAYCEGAFGADMLESVIEDADLPTKGAYTSVGTYPFEEMVALITALVRLSGKDLKSTLEEFGQFCFSKWVNYAPGHFQGRSLFDILANIDQFHEAEVRKLYPDAELPSFQVDSRDESRLVLRYYSCKPLADLATGVIRGAASHLGETIEVGHRTISNDRGAHVRFEITRVG